jgi:hypothetical protein
MTGPVCIDCGHSPCVDFPLDIPAENITAAQPDTGHYRGYCRTLPRRWMARHNTTGVCTCGKYEDLYDVVGHQQDMAPQKVCVTCARAWVTFHRESRQQHTEVM